MHVPLCTSPYARLSMHVSLCTSLYARLSRQFSLFSIPRSALSGLPVLPVLSGFPALLCASVPLCFKTLCSPPCPNQEIAKIPLESPKSPRSAPTVSSIIRNKLLSGVYCGNSKTFPVLSPLPPRPASNSGRSW
jgi:hypothetical protein